MHGAEDLRQPRRRVGGDPLRLEPHRVGVEQRLQVVRRAAELVGDVVERLVEDERPRRAPAERRVGRLLPRRARRRVGHLELRRGAEQAAHTLDVVRPRARAQVEPRAAEAAHRHVVVRSA